MSKFEKGISGNPSGRTPGSMNKRTQLAKLLEPHAESLVNKALELALEGDTNALRLCIERLIPKAKNDALYFSLPASANNTPQDMVQEILKAISGKELTLENLKQVADVLKTFGYSQEVNKDAEIMENAQVLLEQLRHKYKREY